MHRTGTRDQWREERMALLAREKELTRLSDEIARERQALPWVEVSKEYVFDTPDGRRTLAELFDGRSQLVMYHFMLPPGEEEVCASCSSIADGVNGPHEHLEHHDVMFTAVSRAPLEEIEAYRSRMGWSFRWASSHDSDFNFDFLVSSTEERPLRGVQLPRDPGRASASSASGPASARSRSRTARCSTPTRPTSAASTRSGACTRGSTARRRAATRTATGTAAAASTSR